MTCRRIHLPTCRSSVDLLSTDAVGIGLTSVRMSVESIGQKLADMSAPCRSILHRYSTDALSILSRQFSHTKPILVGQHSADTRLNVTQVFLLADMFLVKPLIKSPFFLVQFEDIVESHARTVDITTHNYYDMLYAFHVFRGNYRKG